MTNRILLCLSLAASFGCSPANFSLATDRATFTQNSAYTNGKIDILFVIDNSGSMANSQQALADNISRFFSLFDAKGFDYQMAVTTTDAWRVGFGGDASLAQYRDGTDATSHTGIRVVTPATLHRQTTFITNIKQGTSGSGDERAFQSFQATLDSSLNSGSGFPRADAFFSIIIVSDADDLSNTGATTIDTAPLVTMYSDPSIIPVQTYIDDLDSRFGVTSASARSTKYNVNTIGVLDQACMVQTNGGEMKTAVRTGQLADETNGIKGSMCDDYGQTLAQISNKIIELTTQFYLGRVPIASSLQVMVGGMLVPQLTAASPLPWNGYIWHSETNSLTFYGTAVPAAGATISVDFDPAGIK